MPFSKFEVVPETCGEPCFQKGSLVSGLLRLAGAKLFSEIMKDWVTRMLPIGWFAEILTGVGLRTSLGLWGTRGPTLIWVDQCVSVPYSHCGTALKGEVGGGQCVFCSRWHILLPSSLLPTSTTGSGPQVRQFPGSPCLSP